MRITVVALLLASTLAAQRAEPTAWLDAELGDLVALYREFHRNPEISFREVETSKRLAAALEESTDRLTRNLGGLGVAGLIENGDGPTLMLRADLVSQLEHSHSHALRFSDNPRHFVERRLPRTSQLCAQAACKSDQIVLLRTSHRRC